MKRSKVELSVDISLNDSDDAAFLFQSPTQKRKMKPASPKMKRRKPDLNAFLTRSTIVKSDKAEPTSHLNQTAPGFSGDAIAFPEQKNNSNTFGTNISLDNKYELAISPSKETVKSSTSVINSKKLNSASTSSKNSIKVSSLLCPLCKKKFDSSYAHVSHMKQCAKKKKISTSQLLKTIDEMKAVPEKCSDQDTMAIEPSTSGIRNKATAQDRSKISEDLALATALSISLNTEKETMPKSAKIDKTVVDSQKATLEKFGFTSSSCISMTGNRRGKLNLNRMTALKSRTAEERMQILTEKAAVILLADDKETEQIETKEATTEDESTSVQPEACEKPKLWEIGCSNLSNNWVIDDLKEYITVDEQERIPTPPLDNTSVEYFSPIKLNCSATETRKTTSLSEDWGKLVGSSMWSDGTIKTLDGEVHIHSLVLNVRCPNVDIEYLKVSCCDIKMSSLLSVLNYIYSGQFDKSKARLDDMKILSNLFNRPELLDLMNEKVLTDSMTEVASTSATTPKQVPSLQPNNLDEVHLSEADTVPVTFRESAGNTDDDFIDLTQSGHTSTASDSEDPTEKSYWRIMRQNNDLDDRLDVIEKEREMAKIRSFFEKNKPDNIESDDDYIMDSRERDKIRNLSQGGGGHDPFDSNDDDVEVLDDVASRERQNGANLSDTVIGSDLFQNDVQVLRVEEKKVEETVTVSSDSEDRMFAASTDDDTSNHAANPTDFNLPYFESPPNNDFIDYNRTADLDTTPPSQSFVSANVSPRTPLKILESPFAVRCTPKPTGSMDESPDFITESPENDVEMVSNAINSIPGQSTDASAPRTLQNNETTPKGMKGSSKRRVQPNQFLRRSLLASKARARRSLLTNINADPIALSESVVTGLDESWHIGEPSVAQEDIASCITPIRQGRQFLEVTPRLTPSTKLVNRVTPRPGYTSMKTGSLKKHLQRFGLKQSLGKVKARKILRHIYDELHPYMNTKTGKFLKILPEDDQNKRKVVNKKASPKKKNSGKSSVPLTGVNPGIIKERASPKKTSDKTNDEGASAGLPEVDQHKTLTEGTRTCPRKNNVVKPSIATEVLSNDCPESELSDSTIDDSCSIVNASEDESDIHAGDVLTQSNTDFDGLSTDDILKKIIRENKDLHRKILQYEPIWLESLLKEIKTTHKVKMTKGVLVDFCDKHCIVFKSEVDAANTQRRNVKRQVRTQKRKEKATSSASQQYP